MAEKLVSGKSVAEVALNLLEIVARAEGKNLLAWDQGIDRKYVLETYQQCLRVAQGGDPE